MSDRKDPRVLFAARTLLAWGRSGPALIAFGFIVERAGLLLALQHRSVLKALNPQEIPQGYSLWLAPVASLVVPSSGASMALFLLPSAL